MPIRAIFTEGIKELTVSGLHQWDYGQKLEIHGLALPALIEVHFACLNMTEAHVRVGSTADGVTTVSIPDGCLEHDTPLRAWVYVVDTASGHTERTIHLPIQARTKPQGADSRQPFVVDEYAEAIDKINKTVDGWRDGIVDQNDGDKIKVWEGTRAEFNALTKTDAHTMYVITDELPDYTDLVRMYEELEGEVQALKEMRETSDELIEYLQEVKEGETIVPQAAKAHYDAQGRILMQYGYLGGKFQKTTKLTEEGTYQIVADIGGFEYYIPLVVFNNWVADTPRCFPVGYGMTLKIMKDGSLAVYKDSDNTEVWEVLGYYARKVSPISGW